MSIDELKKKIDEYEAGLKEKSGKMIRSSETGPVSMSLIRDMFQVLERQQKEIDALKAKVDKPIFGS